VRAILRGELPRLLAGPEQAATIDRLQATMAIVEGYAEHVMDAAGAGRRPAFERLRARMDARRAGRGGLGEAIARVLGLELKLRQYAVGRRFCEAVAEAGGIEALNLVWSSPDALPSPSDLDRPRDWLRRARDMSLEPATRI
jgi:putative hydrolase